MSSSVKLMTDKLNVKLRFKKLGNKLSLAIGVQFEAKN